MQTAHFAAEGDDPERQQPPMMSVSIESRLVWRRFPPRQVQVPEGTRIHGFLEAAGYADLRDQALLVISGRVCDPEREVLPGDAVLLLAVICGG